MSQLGPAPIENKSNELSRCVNCRLATPFLNARHLPTRATGAGRLKACVVGYIYIYIYVHRLYWNTEWRTMAELE